MILDTHILIWAVSTPDYIPKSVFVLLESAIDIFFSPINLYEISIKQSIGKLSNARKPSDYAIFAYEQGWRILDFEIGVFDVYTTLPQHHNDPFDRMLIAQAMYHNLNLATTDSIFERYDIKTLGLES